MGYTPRLSNIHVGHFEIQNGGHQGSRWMMCSHYIHIQHIKTTNVPNFVLYANMNMLGVPGGDFEIQNGGHQLPMCQLFLYEMWT
jgi:hypothetical protein